MTLNFILRIFVAAILGGFIGLEREYREKAAADWLERVSQAKRQSRSPRSKADEADIPGDGTSELKFLYPPLFNYDNQKNLSTSSRLYSAVSSMSPNAMTSPA